jgi:DNA-binding transcriptional MocR family regulator
MWSDPKTATIMRTAAETYARRREALIDELKKYGIEARGRSGLNVWIPVAEEAAVVHAMAGRGWAIRAGECYRLRSATGIRVTVSTMTREESRRFAADLAAAIRPRSSAQSG